MYFFMKKVKISVFMDGGRYPLYYDSSREEMLWRREKQEDKSADGGDLLHGLSGKRLQQYSVEL